MALEDDDDAPGWDAATAEVLAVIRAKGEAGCARSFECCVASVLWQPVVACLVTGALAMVNASWSSQAACTGCMDRLPLLHVVAVFEGGS